MADHHDEDAEPPAGSRRSDHATPASRRQLVDASPPGGHGRAPVGDRCRCHSDAADAAEAAPGEVGDEAGELLGRLLGALGHPEAAGALGQADEAVGELAALRAR